MMRNYLKSIFTALLIFVAYLGCVFLVQHATPNVRVDLTENKLFSLSKGSLKVLGNIQKPIEFHLYYSEKEARPYPQFRQYAERVIEKIEEYSAQSNNNVVLTLIDPEPYSIAEDAATARGIVAVPLDNGAGPLYFGLTAKSGDSVQTIGFIKPESEHFLEYELTKLIQSVQIKAKPKVLLVSDLAISGNNNIEQGLLSPAWVVFRQLAERYQLTHVSSENLV
ncbi:MAG TPA: GldG family protein, partial [Arenimonas sp.]|nr:GldG family protein [Arenimonas sp.]